MRIRGAMRAPSRTSTTEGSVDVETSSIHTSEVSEDEMQAKLIQQRVREALASGEDVTPSYLVSMWKRLSGDT